MKSHLITSAIVFIAGTVVAFIASNMIMPGIEDFNIETINLDSATTLSDPDAEVFNYRAINPTVEVYVGGDEDNSEENTPNENIPNNNENNGQNNNTPNEDNENPDNPPEENDDGTTD